MFETVEKPQFPIGKRPRLSDVFLMIDEESRRGVLPSTDPVLPWMWVLPHFDTC